MKVYIVFSMLSVIRYRRSISDMHFTLALKVLNGVVATNLNTLSRNVLRCNKVRPYVEK